MNKQEVKDYICTGLRSVSYVLRIDDGAIPFTTDANFHARLCASCMPVFIPEIKKMIIQIFSRNRLFFTSPNV